MVSITDNAGGIPEEIIGKVFDPNFTTKGSDQGPESDFHVNTIIEKNMNGSLCIRNLGNGADFRIEV